MTRSDPTGNRPNQTNKQRAQTDTKTRERESIANRVSGFVVLSCLAFVYCSANPEMP